MDCSTANKISIEEFLLSKGISPKSKTSKNSWYLSPLHPEKTASFKVERGRNLWYDFSTGYHGRLIDLVCKIYPVDVPGALKIISGTAITPQSFSFDKQKENTTELGSTTEIKHVQPLQNRALIQYLENRGIPFQIAAKYTKEVYYNTYEGQVKSFFAIGFENDLGGFELRNGFKSKNFPEGFKGGNTPKTITTIHGHPEKLNVFEGFMNFLSALVFYQRPEPGNTTIILNGVGHAHQIYKVIPNFSRVNLFLDNDPSGEKATNEIIAQFQGVTNHAKIIYPDYNDFNDFICKIQKP